MKLRTKFAIVLLVITVVLSGSVYGGLELYKDRIIQQNREDLNETATLTARQLDEAIEDQKDFVGYVASRPEAARFDQSDQFLRQFVDNSRFIAAQIVDGNGTVVHFHGDITRDVQQESIGADVGHRSYVAGPLAGEIYVSDPLYVNTSDQYLIIISAPIIEERRITGVLTAAIYLDDQTFFGILRPISRADQRVTLTAGPATLYQRGIPIENTYEVSRTVESTGWTVTVGRDQSSLLDRLRQLAYVQGIGIFFVMLSVVSFGVWEYRTTLAQTEKLLEGFAVLREGSFDHELSLTAAEEWEQISRGFNALATGLAVRESALRQREQRLEVLNRVLRHNLRNATTIVLGYAEVIRSRSDDERVLDAIDRIETTGAHLQGLSTKAQQLSQMIEQSESQVRIDVTRLVDDVLETVREEFPAVDVNSSMPASAWVVADYSLRMAIANVCENACEHNDALDPRLDVIVTRNLDSVAIEMADNGEGIPDHEWQVLDAGEETPLEHGSGLGLWVAQWAVELSDGTLHFESNQSTGTTVRIELQATESGNRVDENDEMEENNLPEESEETVEDNEVAASWPEDWPTYVGSSAHVHTAQGHGTNK